MKDILLILITTIIALFLLATLPPPDNVKSYYNEYSQEVDQAEREKIRKATEDAADQMNYLNMTIQAAF